MSVVCFIYNVYMQLCKLNLRTNYSKNFLFPDLVYNQTQIFGCSKLAFELSTCCGVAYLYVLDLFYIVL